MSWKMQKQYFLAAAVLASLLVSATSSVFAFYKLTLTWPTSYCNVRSFCKQPYPDYFTIHGLWPTFANDTKVPKYGPQNLCVDVVPTPTTELEDALQPIKAQLDEKWPTLVSNKANIDFWKHEWEYHGMCSDYPTQPRQYFQAGLDLTAMYDPFNVMGIQRGAETTTGTLLDTVYQKLRAYPQLSCNLNGQVRQLMEVRFCFDTTTPPSLPLLRSCPSRFDGACTNWNDTIKFPSVPQSSSYIIREVVSL